MVLSLWSNGVLADDFLICQQVRNSLLFILSADPASHPQLQVSYSGFIGVGESIIPPTVLNYERGTISRPVDFYSAEGLRKSHPNLDAILLTSSDGKIQVALTVDTVDSTGEKVLVGRAFQSLYSKKAVKRGQGFKSGISLSCTRGLNPNNFESALLRIESLTQK